MAAKAPLDSLLAGVDLVALTGVNPKKAAGTNGGEYKGACPLCGGDDRFLVWPNHPGGRGRFWCRQCDRKGDAIDFVRERDGLTFPEAVRALGGDASRGQLRPSTTAPRSPAPPQAVTPPSPRWQERGRLIMERTQARLWEPDSWALAELHRRGLGDETIRAAGLGDNPVTWYDDPAPWGLSGKRVWLPRGIVIPWLAGGELWRLNIRRRADDLQDGQGPKFIGPWGWAGGNPLYNADAVAADKPVILVEGELDAMTLQQHAGDLVTPVATGSTEGARCLRWIARLALAPAVLVAYDADPAGDKAAAWWVARLSNAKRWRPYWGDANEMAQDGADLRGWVAAGVPLRPAAIGDVAEPVQVPTSRPTGTAGPAILGPGLSQVEQRELLEACAAGLADLGAVVIPAASSPSRAANGSGPSPPPAWFDGEFDAMCQAAEALG